MCSRIRWKANGQPVIVGRNMDWTARMGTKLYAFPKGIERDELVDECPLKWTSRYGSLVSFVWDCATAMASTRGVNVNLLYLAKAKYA